MNVITSFEVLLSAVAISVSFAQKLDPELCKTLVASSPDYCSKELALIQCEDECAGIAKDPPKRPKSIKKDDNVAKCCKQQGVPEPCDQLCSYAPKNSSMACSVECAPHIRKWLYCAANGKDISACCRKKGASPRCATFCNGKAPENYPRLDEMFESAITALPFLSCFHKGPEILQCLERESEPVPKYQRDEPEAWEDDEFPENMVSAANKFCRKWRKG